MRMIGLPAFSSRVVQTVALKVPAGQKAAKEYVWPLDVGPRTMAQVLESAPWLKRGTLYQRLVAGDRRFSSLIRRPDKMVGRVGTAKQQEAQHTRAHKKLWARTIQADRIAYMLGKRAQHKDLS